MNVHRQRGFTFVEVVLVVAMVAVLSAAGPRFTRALTDTGGADTAARTVLAAIRSAQRSALALTGDVPWGVHVTSVSATVFSGADWMSRDTAADRSYLFELPVRASTSDVVFQPGPPPAASLTDVRITQGDAVRTVIVSSYGTSFIRIDN